MKNNHISVLAPMGAAFIGFHNAEDMAWKVPFASKTFVNKRSVATDLIHSGIIEFEE